MGSLHRTPLHQSGIDLQLHPATIPGPHHMEQPQHSLLLGNAKGVDGPRGMGAYLWVEAGIAEQNLVSISAGLAKTGKKARLSIWGQNA